MAKFDELGSSNLKADQKKEVMFRQWKFIKEWAEMGKMKPGANPTGGVAACFAHLHNKLQDAQFIAKVNAAMVLHADEAAAEGGVLGNELCKLPAVALMEEEFFENKKRKILETVNKDVRSKKHRDEEAEDALMKGGRVWEWYYTARLPLYKKRLAKAAREEKAGEKKAKHANEQGGNN